MKRTQTILITTIVLSFALTSVFAIDFNERSLETTSTNLPFFFAQADKPEDSEPIHHEIEMEAVKMPDGMYAYRMVSYDTYNDEGWVADLVDDGIYKTKPSIPGPTLVFTEGDTVDLTLHNNACDDFVISGAGTIENSLVGVHVHGVHYDINDDATYQRMNMGEEPSAAACGGSIDYFWDVSKGTEGAWPYHDHTFYQNEVGAEDLGLFGTVIVNPEDGEVDAIVDNKGRVKQVDLEEINKEFVLWMVSSEVLGRSVFYGMEIDNQHPDTPGKQTPLWVNPNLYTEEGEKVRFHVIGLGDETHAFHLHGHRWADTQVEKSDIIDVKEVTPLQRHSFVVTASDNDGADDTPGNEGWMYHCHVFEHMEAGMSGMMMVVDEDTLPDVGATFTISDEPGLWFKTLDAGVLDVLDEAIEEELELPVGTISKAGTGFAPKWLGLTAFSDNDFANTEGRSLAVLSKDSQSTLLFNMKDSQTKHTITNLLWPSGAKLYTVDGPEDYGGMDVDLTIRGSTFLVDSEGRPAWLEDEGLYAFVCKIHPYMFAAVLVDDPSTNILVEDAIPILDGEPDITVPILDLPEKHIVLTRTTAEDDMLDDNLIFDSLSELPQYITEFDTAGTDGIILSLVRTVYIASDPNNWKDYTQENWVVSTPPVPIYVENVVDAPDAPLILNDLIDKNDPISDTPLFDPTDDGVGEVWVNTQFERTMNKNHPGSPADKPGTITVVDVGGDDKWTVERKVALPQISMNHPHNMWANAAQDTVYQTQWFDSRMVTIERETGEMVKDVYVGQSPSHVMTAPAGNNEGKIYVAVNGEEELAELDPNTLELTRQFSTGSASHPHGHWISNDGKYMVTPNFFISESTIVNLSSETSTNVKVGFTPIATGMKPDGSSYYTSDFLGNSFTEVSTSTATVMDSIDLINHGLGPQGIPVQNPVSPDGDYMVAATVLTSEIVVVDTNVNEIVRVLPCDPGCHGVQWGAKDHEDGGYYAYVSNKFSNALIVVDPKDGYNAEIAGRILLNQESGTETDDRIIGYAGMGGQGVLPVPNVYYGWLDQTVDACNEGLCSGQIEGFLTDLDDSHFP
jgi:DNA-binding beta-propeller fold protein YncE